MTLDAITTEPVREKLMTIREYISPCGWETHEFAKVLGERLNQPRVTPESFVVQALFLVDDLKGGADRRSEPPITIQSRLTGYLPVFYSFLERNIPLIAAAVCPSDFAAKVRQYYDEIRR